MKPSTITKEDLDLCLERFLIDAKDDFFPDPVRYLDLRLIRKDIVERLRGDLSRILKAKTVTYPNHPFSDSDVPKHNFVIRHAINMHPMDRIAYHFILHKLAPRMERTLSKARYSFRVKAYKQKHIFGKRKVSDWLEFKDAIKELFDNNAAYKFLVSTDVAGFFEYIHLTDFKKQMCNLCKAKDNDPIIQLLHAFLRNFSPSNHSGIPQNYDPSSYLASAFLDFLDKDLEAAKYKHFRYVDDIKVACRTTREAQVAIIEIIRSLRRFNLNVATHKTEIWQKDEPEFQRFLRPFPSVLEQTDEAVARKDKVLINRCLPRLTKKVKPMLKKGAKEFEDRLFRALIWRIVKCHWFKGIARMDLSGIGKACMRLLEQLPSRSDTFVRFLVLEKDKKYVHDGLYEILRGAIYPWQEMQIWSLLIQSHKIKNKELISLARERFLNHAYPEAARNYLIIYLGKFGTYQDRNKIATLVKQGSSYFTTRCALVALQEHPDREQVYKKVATVSTDETIKSLIRYIRQLKQPQYLYVDDRIGSDRTFIEDIVEPY